MNDKMIKLLGLSRRAGKCAPGASAVIAGIKRKKCFLVIIARNAGDSTKSKFVNLCENFNVKYIFCDDKYALGNAVGFPEKSVVGITDSGFAKGIFDCILDMEVSDL